MTYIGLFGALGLGLTQKLLCSSALALSGFGGKWVMTYSKTPNRELPRKSLWVGILKLENCGTKGYVLRRRA